MNRQSYGKVERTNLSSWTTEQRESPSHPSRQMSGEQQCRWRWEPEWREQVEETKTVPDDWQEPQRAVVGAGGGSAHSFES